MRFPGCAHSLYPVPAMRIQLPFIMKNFAIRHVKSQNITHHRNPFNSRENRASDKNRISALNVKHFGLTSQIKHFENPFRSSSREQMKHETKIGLHREPVKAKVYVRILFGSAFRKKNSHYSPGNGRIVLFSLK